MNNFYTSLDKETIWHGSHCENDHQITLRAGNLSMKYENGNLRYIKDGKNEIIRMIYPAVRDREWLTVNPEITGEKIEVNDISFIIEYCCLYKSGEINFSARYQIKGNANNSLSFIFEGEALETFEKNRIGFCVLHPVEGCAGKPCTITHSDGNSEELSFPVYISPVQPLKDIKLMQWNVGGSECCLSFSGDIFETEDQRNWTDASYKTYCTPLGLPFPATIRKGERMSQSVELEIHGANNTEKSENIFVKITLDSLCSSVLPLIGTGRSTRPEPMTEDEMKIFMKLRFDHYRTDIYLFRENWKQVAGQAAGEGAAMNYSNELAIFFDDNYLNQMDDFIGWIISSEPAIAVLSLFHRYEAVIPAHLMEIIAKRLKNLLPDVKIICGTNANFAQLNRSVPASEFMDYLCYSIHPQEHASDNATIVENLQAQAYTVESAVKFAHGKGIWISPVTIRRRFNANVENFESQIANLTFPPQADSRLMSIFGACWTVGSLKYLSEAGVKGITFFETVGERGIMQGSFDSRWPEEFKTVKGMIFPVFHLFAWLLKEKSFRIIQSISSGPLEVECLALSDGRKLKIAVSNFTSSEKYILFDGLSGEFKTKKLNAESYADAASDPGWIDNDPGSMPGEGNQLIIEPYSLNFIDGFLR